MLLVSVISVRKPTVTCLVQVVGSGSVEYTTWLGMDVPGADGRWWFPLYCTPAPHLCLLPASFVPKAAAYR